MKINGIIENLNIGMILLDEMMMVNEFVFGLVLMDMLLMMKIILLNVFQLMHVDLRNNIQIHENRNQNYVMNDGVLSVMVEMLYLV